MNTNEVEQNLAKCKDSDAKQIATNLLSEVLKLRHELNDPRFMYNGGRAMRQTIVNCNAELDKYRNMSDLDILRNMLRYVETQFSRNNNRTHDKNIVSG